MIGARSSCILIPKPDSTHWLVIDFRNLTIPTDWLLTSETWQYPPIGYWLQKSLKNRLISKPENQRLTRWSIIVTSLKHIKYKDEVIAEMQWWINEYTVFQFHFCIFDFIYTCSSLEFWRTKFSFISFKLIYFTANNCR